jgi:hypothetical protein
VVLTSGMITVYGLFCPFVSHSLGFIKLVHQHLLYVNFQYLCLADGLFSLLIYSELYVF